ncbi:hypothetical protein [Roseateles terrae]|uniref:Uncharacterized protein n=1 Tax=Roseateles terrae TaxID=431060 RepID=A0ABR6GTC1_9BURK|nr:hypothetical protein [Roseateles terrae]MBB3195347.1 hypothetical protein [Roseateles terrae]OWQ87337.1 hypothetical protein CDN98_10980 [Roseateles terrae]
MPQSDQLEKERQRLTGQAQHPHEKVPTYQELLDAAIEDTFPASDPIAVGGATKIAEPHTTLRDAKDWSLKPGSETIPGEAGAQAPSGGPEVSAPCDGFVERPMTLQSSVDAAVQVPRGPCTIEQSEHRAVLRWMADGQSRRGALSIEEYRDRLADGSLRRGGPCAEPEETGASS